MIEFSQTRIEKVLQKQIFSFFPQGKMPSTINWNKQSCLVNTMLFQILLKPTFPSSFDLVFSYWNSSTFFLLWKTLFFTLCRANLTLLLLRLLLSTVGLQIRYVQLKFVLVGSNCKCLYMQYWKIYFLYLLLDGNCSAYLSFGSAVVIPKLYQTGLPLLLINTTT